MGKRVSVRLHVYSIIAERIEGAAALIASRLFKHTPRLTVKQVPEIAETIEREIMNALEEVIDFTEELGTP